MSKVLRYIRNVFNPKKSQGDLLRFALSEDAMNRAARGSMERRSALLRRVSQG